MRKIVICGLCLLMPMSAMAIPGGLTIGEKCYTSEDAIGNESLECFTGLVCLYVSSKAEGTCIPDCTYVDGMENMDIYVAQAQGWQQTMSEGIFMTLCTKSTSDREHVEFRYRCPLGAYGRPTDDSSGCTPCPNNGQTNTGPVDAPIGGYAITSCVLPAGSTATDSAGTFTVTADCPWVE